MVDDLAKPAPVIDGLDLQTRIDRIERLRAARTTPEQMRRAATEFEAVFTRQVVEMMFQGLDEDTIFGGGHGGRVFKEFLYDEYARVMAEKGTLGVGDMVYDQMMRRYGAILTEPAPAPGPAQTPPAPAQTPSSPDEADPPAGQKRMAPK